MDVHDQKTRSLNMSRIHSRNTTIELIVRQFLFKNGYRYRLHYAKLPGKPDLVILNHRIAIFVNGCYFHRHEGCKLATVSETNKDFWNNKIESNVMRDNRNEEILIALGWTVLKIWECEIEPRKKYSLKRAQSLESLKNTIIKITN